MTALVFTVLSVFLLVALAGWWRAKSYAARCTERFDALYHAAPIGIALLDRDLKLQSANQRFLDTFCVTSMQDLIGVSFAVDPNCKTVFRQYAEQGERGPFEVVYSFAEVRAGELYRTHGDGTVFLEFQFQSAAGLGTGVSSGVVLMVRDITQRTHAEHRLRDQEAFYSVLIDSMPIGVFVKEVSADFQYTLWNGYMEKEFSLSRKKIIGKQDAEVFSERTALNARQDDLDVVYGKVPMSIEATGSYFGAGEDRVCSIIKAPLIDREGNVTALMGVVRDITAERLQEQMLQHARKMEAVGRLAGGVAHDFNNMLQAILGYTDMVMEDLGDRPDVVENLGEVMRAGRRAMIMVRQLLAFSRRDVLEPQRVDINEQIREVNGLLRRMVGEGIEVVIDDSRGVKEIYGDPAQIEQILINLCLNARDALDGQGSIFISTEDLIVNKDGLKAHDMLPAGEYVVLRVGDNGCGMSEAVREHVFEPFFTTKDVDRGAGLGLATVYAIVKKHQAEIRCHNRAEGGTDFCIYFRAYAADAVPELPAGQRTVMGADAVLLVEDDEQVRVLTAEILRKQGVAVTEVADAASARLRLKNDRAINALISDVIMPEESGWELYKYVKSARPELPVVLCSAYSDRELPDELVRSKSVSLLRKPFTKEQLLDAVNRASEQVHRQESDE